MLRYAIVRRWALLFVVGCSGPGPQPLRDHTPSPDAAFVMEKDAGAPSCKVQTAAQGVCECIEVGLLTDVPNLYFVLDRSGSMSEDGKWDTVRDVIARTVSQLGPRVRVGVAVFPGLANGCSTGIETLSVRQGDVAPSPNELSMTAKAVLSATALAASGGTPTAATLRALEPSITKLAGRTYVVLATDGGPNCNASASCGAETCIPNIEGQPSFCSGATNCCDKQYYGPLQCLDAQPTIDAVASLAKKNVPTYIVGVPGSAPYANLLDQLAQVAGTARSGSPAYYRVDGTDPAAFSAALAKVAAKISATCTYPLSKIPDDPGMINVFLDGKPIANDPVDGWTLWGSVVTLMGASCDRVLSGEVLQVRVVEGCPTITPN
jgi:hypothetical protein